MFVHAFLSFFFFFFFFPVDLFVCWSAGCMQYARDMHTPSTELPKHEIWSQKFSKLFQTSFRINKSCPVRMQFHLFVYLLSHTYKMKMMRWNKFTNIQDTASKLLKGPKHANTSTLCSNMSNIHRYSLKTIISIQSMPKNKCSYLLKKIQRSVICVMIMAPSPFAFLVSVVLH